MESELQLQELCSIIADPTSPAVLSAIADAYKRVTELLSSMLQESMVLRQSSSLCMEEGGFELYGPKAAEVRSGHLLLLDVLKARLQHCLHKRWDDVLQQLMVAAGASKSAAAFLCARCARSALATPQTKPYRHPI